MVNVTGALNDLRLWRLREDRLGEPGVEVDRNDGANGAPMFHLADNCGHMDRGQGRAPHWTEDVGIAQLREAFEAEQAIPRPGRVLFCECLCEEINAEPSRGRSRPGQRSASSAVSPQSEVVCPVCHLARPCYCNE